MLNLTVFFYFKSFTNTRKTIARVVFRSLAITQITYIAVQYRTTDYYNTKDCDLFLIGNFCGTTRVVGRWGH